MTRQNQQVGKHGQQQAASYLAGSVGLLMVHVIGTPARYVPFHGAYRKDVFQVIFGEKVAGDHRALLPDGSSVLIEVKTVTDGNLPYSQLEAHQVRFLTEHASIGHAVSLLVWVHHSGIFVMRWTADGIPGFAPRKSITPERAVVLHEQTMEYLEGRMKG
jgi:hypothetical protein